MIEIEDDLINSFKDFLESEEAKKALEDRQERKRFQHFLQGTILKTWN